MTNGPKYSSAAIREAWEREAKTALGQQDARQRPQPTDRENARNGANVRILARPEQDPWTFHRRRQRRCGRPAQCRWTSRIENPPAFFTLAGQLASSLRSVGVGYSGLVPIPLPPQQTDAGIRTPPQYGAADCLTGTLRPLSLARPVRL